MVKALQIDPSWHPLINGCPPAFATEWGEDQFGIFIAFSLGEVTQRLRWIPAGAFRMGSPDDEPGRFVAEGPQHTVFISRGFWLFATPCTQALWETVTGENPSRFKSADRPVAEVSWNEVQDFLARINTRIPGLDLVLPTEAQWEHACRAGTDTAIYTGPIDITDDNNAPALDPIAWYSGNSSVDFDLDDGVVDSIQPAYLQSTSLRPRSHPVGKNQPNPWGLYDMLGNVWEWCADGLRGYDTDFKVDPFGPQMPDASRVVRGGSWEYDARYCRSAYRSRRQADARGQGIGVRLARTRVS